MKTSASSTLSFLLGISAGYAISDAVFATIEAAIGAVVCAICGLVIEEESDHDW